MISGRASVPEVLMRPEAPRRPYPRLHLIINEHHVILIGQLPKRLHKLRPEVVIPALALDGLYDDRTNVIPMLHEGLLDLRNSQRLDLLHPLYLCIRNRETQLRIDYRGQSNLAKYRIFAGSVFVRLIV